MDSVHSTQETKKARTKPSLPSQAPSAKRGELSRKYEGGHLAITASREASPKALARARATQKKELSLSVVHGVTSHVSLQVAEKAVLIKPPNSP